jgi:AcrR family transcriptional regulator
VTTTTPYDGRAAKILDAAADLLIRHGYRRVTIEDIAVAAGIGKGTVYLHWRTREELFGAVFQREVDAAIGELVAALKADPGVALLHRFAEVFFLAILRRPLLHGMVIGDAQMWGKLVGAERDLEPPGHEKVAVSYVELLAARGLLRKDMTPGELSYAFQAVFEGFVYAERTAGHGTLEERAALLARTIRAAFEAPAPGDAPAAELIELLEALRA